ncbi:WEB family protein, chloroplastic [Capsicum annuum]|uniref:WEB family protein At5g16730, chloroplastic n=1 Tax=Capsicum annuum TaxID=4072 RepID=UPI0007BEBC76|nr:WEB family protein At5g16730, chloroplastic [Capsicum annuum]XP_016578128.1 WEB family protein At5g16730, chloroplastic [Capsicum annuum]XP_047269943.1 WEB family protein At5g16730, chloroplastic [Capsicum annuum]KAF3639849.1 WEB family protein, chloroplastic [Capsicum annuum]KAF3640501.1 WEB family protein, chloroplastic [Capsicum annuum]
MSTKSKSTLNGTPSNSTPVTPRISRVIRGLAKSDADSSSPLQHSRSVDRSVRSAITSKPPVERRTSKLCTLPDKKPTRVLKPSELQAELNVAREDLKKAKEMLALVEKEKVQALEEVKEAQILAEEANEKLREALLDQKQAEDNSEIEAFRAVEMEQVGIEEWQKEVEAVRNQHAVDVAALLSATQELQRVKRELSMACEAKNKALSNAEDAAKIAETHAEKVEILSAELVRLKSLLDSKISWNETEVSEKNRLVEELKLEIETLKEELEKAKSYEAQLVKKEAIVKQLNIDLEAAKMAESNAHNVLEEWKKKIEELDAQAEEAHHLERSASATLESVMKQLEASNNLLHDAESEIAYLKEKVGVLEMSMVRQKDDLEESEHHAQMAKEEASELRKKVNSLMYDLETVKEEKIQAMENEKVAAARVQTLSEQKNRLVNDLESFKEEEEKSKKAMESLASALHEVSSEAREAKERLLSNQADQHEHYETQLEDLKMVLKATEERYESMLDDAKEKLDVLTNSTEQSKDALAKWKAEWEEKELHLMSCMNKTEEENASMEHEISRLVNLIKDAEEQASAKKDEEAYLKNSLRKSESEVSYLKEVLGEAMNESARLQERLMAKEKEVQNIIRENEELQSREAASLKKVEELSMLLEESLAKNEPEPSVELSDSEKDYYMHPKVVKFSDQIEKPNMDLPPYQSQEVKKLNEHENIAKDDDENQKKKKPLFHKFGSLLRKKSTSSLK